MVPSLTALSMFSLMGGYLASRADKTLVATGDLEAMAPRRLAETLNWVVDVTAPDALQRFGRGFTSTLRVRLMHAMVRAGMARRPDWDFEDWDHPVNQSTMAGTLMLFSLGNVLGSQALGVQFSRQDKDALYHFWRYVGFCSAWTPNCYPPTKPTPGGCCGCRPTTSSGRTGTLRLGQALKSALGPLAIGDSPHPRPRSAGQSRPKSSAPGRLILGSANADAWNCRQQGGTGGRGRHRGDQLRRPLPDADRARAGPGVRGRRPLHHRAVRQADHATTAVTGRTAATTLGTAPARSRARLRAQGLNPRDLCGARHPRVAPPTGRHFRQCHGRDHRQDQHGRPTLA